MSTEFNFPIYHYSKNSVNVCIEDYFENVDKSELKVGTGYVYDGCVWKYIDKPLHGPENYPSISYDKDGNVVTQTDLDGKVYTIEEVANSRLNLICNQTTDDMDFRKDNSISHHASSTAVYIPEIKESDDFLKKLIKLVFLIKRVPTSKYRRKLSKAYAFSNLFQGLNNDTKISTTVWQTWIEILGIDAVIILKDSGGDSDPINDYIVYKSRNDSQSIVSKDDIIEHLKECL